MSEAQSVRLEEENKRLRRAVDELAILNDLALAISGSLDSQKIMRSIVSRSIRAIHAEQGDITLVDEDQMNPSHTLVRSMISSSSSSPLHLNQNLLGWMQINKKPLVINDPRNDQRFRNVQWDPSIRSVLSAPLTVRSKLIGILTLYNSSEPQGFSESEQRLLAIIAAQSGQVVENARLYEEELELQNVRREMDLAASIQKKLIPGLVPVIDGYTIAGRNMTAQTVGGDYYDFIKMDENRWALCLGDISGKGLPASLLMANLQAVLRGHVLHVDKPAAILRHANRQLYQSTSPEKFATLFLGILDCENHTLTYSSGGHEHPYLLRADGNDLRLQAGGVPLGMIDGMVYQEETVELRPGDCLYIFSDGVTDNVNSEMELYGEERMQSVLKEGYSEHQQPDKLIDKIFRASMLHSGKDQLFDDMTAVVLMRNG
jgi:phosphoserine phosphatase RsbU/P